MKRALHFIAGYILGFTVFFIIIPYVFFKLSMLDYIFDYRMIVKSMALRYALTGVLFLIGITFVIWSNVFLFIKGKGGPAEGMGISVSPKTKKLVISGPYKYCRNPMVFGAITVFLALVIYLNSISGLIALILLSLFAGVYLKHSEEKRLKRDFGQEFLEYRKKVPMIFPMRQNRNQEI